MTRITSYGAPPFQPAAASPTSSVAFRTPWQYQLVRGRTAENSGRISTLTTYRERRQQRGHITAAGADFERILSWGLISAPATAVLSSLVHHHLPMAEQDRHVHEREVTVLRRHVVLAWRARHQDQRARRSRPGADLGLHHIKAR